MGLTIKNTGLYMMIRKTPVLLVAIFMMVIIYAVSGQTYRFNTYRDKGYSANQIFSLLQDDRGYIWIGSGVGLSRYDSDHFQTFTVENGLPANEILSLAQDSSGALWVGTALGMARIYPRKDGTVDIKNGLTFFSRYSISALAIQKDWLWIGTRRNGLYRISLKRQAPVKTLEKGVSVKEIKLSADGSVWVLDENGLKRYNMSGRLLKNYPLDLGARLKSFLPVRNSIWLGSGRGLYRLDMENGRPRFFSLPGVASIDVNRMIAGRDGALWLAVNKGLFRIDGDKVNYWHKKNGLPGEDIRALLFDAENNLWAGSYTNGLFSFSNRYVFSYTEKDGLLSPAVNCVTDDPATGRRLLATDRGIFITAADGLSRDPRFTALNDKIIWFIYHDNSGDLWLGGEDVLMRYSGGGLRPVRLAPVTAECTFLDMLQDKTGRYWFATTIGLFARDGQGEYAFPEFARHDIRSVWDVFQASGDTLFFGTDNGLAFYDGKTFEFVQDTRGLPDRAIYTIAEDSDGGIWLGGDRGIILRKNNRYTLYGREAGFEGTIIAQILSDPSRKGLWVCTDKGIQFFKDGRAGRPFRAIDGLAGDEFTTQNSTWMAPDGRLWLGVFGGLTVLDPQWMFREMPQPRVFYRRAGFSAFPDSQLNVLNAEVTIPYDQANILFDVQGIYYYNPSALRLEYRLEGYDTDWRQTRPVQVIRYNRLSPGKYHFRIRARLGDQIIPLDSLDRSFEVEHPFWFSWWFIVLVFVVAMFPLLLYFRYQSGKMEEVNKALQEQISKNSRDLALAEALLENIVEHSGHILITVDVKGRIVTWNKRAEEIFGFSKDYILHKSVSLLDIDNDPATFDSILKDTLRGGVLRMLEIKKKSADGRLVELVATATALKDRDHKNSLISLDMEDFSERNRLMELRINRERLLAGIEALNRLLATLSHYINNSIASISGMAQLVQMDDSYQDKFNEITQFQVRRIQAVLASLGELVRSLNVQTRDYVGEDDRLFDIEQQINAFIDSFHNTKKKEDEASGASRKDNDAD